MSELRHTPQIPDTMPYTEAEKELARKKQQEVAAAKKRKRNGIIAGIGGGAVLLTGGLFAGKSLAGGEATPEPGIEPTASAPANPGEEKPTQTEVGLNAEQLTSPEAVIAAYQDIENEWYMDGATLENKKANDFSLTPEEYAAKVAGAEDDKYINALFVENWQSNPTLNTFVETVQNVHAETVFINFFTTDSGDSRDQESYKLWIEFSNTQIVDQSPSEITATVDFAYKDNSEYNRAMEYLPTEIEEYTGTQTITWTVVDGKWKISNVQV